MMPLNMAEISFTFEIPIRPLGSRSIFGALRRMSGSLAVSAGSVERKKFKKCSVPTHGDLFHSQRMSLIRYL